MGDTAQACLNAPQHQRLRFFEILAYQIGVNYDSAVGTTIIPASGGQIVTESFFLRCRVIGNHRIHAAAGDAPE